MAIAPLCVKYQTQSGHCYVYDPGTNEIVRIGETIYTLLDDCGVLGTDEMIAKYHSLGSHNVRKALAEIEALQGRDILCGRNPQISSVAQRLLCQGREESFEAFLGSHRRLLILELTQRCNLRCEYCVYGEHYSEMRRHSEYTMSLETARDAVKDFVGHASQKYFLCFYGGEPLLEFTLLKQIVFYAEILAQQHGIRIDLSLTTNGTLLTDDVLHFLVKHEFDVRISLDGGKESHDRYRVFRNDEHPESKRGTYDIVMKNINRFIELYPEYSRRSIALTVTATSDLDESNTLLRQLRSSRFTSTTGFVRDTRNGSREEADDLVLGTGSWGASSCEPRFCGKELDNSEGGGYGESGTSNSLADRVGSGGSPKTLEFCNWTGERRHCLRLSRIHFIDEVCKRPDAVAVEDEFPLVCDWFAKDTRTLHLRAISKHTAILHFAYKCYPGATRTFYSAQGVVYPCEKGETGKVFEIGDATNGVTLLSALRFADAVRLLADCGNCIVKRICSLCPAMVSEIGRSGKADALAFQDRCRMRIAALPGQLAEYTAVMETNQAVVDNIITKGPGKDDWLNDVKIVPTAEQLREVDLGVEELEGIT